jgi:hypothetical protein
MGNPITMIDIAIAADRRLLLIAGLAQGVPA